MSEKTIRMPKALLDKWLAALRSGEYKQATGTLFDESCGGYCCLGLLQNVSGSPIERLDDGEPRSLPTRGWLESNGVQFKTDIADKDVTPFLPSLNLEAHQANDGGKTFAEIADAIEACAEAT